MQKVPGAHMGDLGRSGVPGALRKSPGVKKHGEHACDGPGARFGRFGGWKIVKATQNFSENVRNFSVPTGREIVVSHASGALRKTPGAEKRGEQAYNGPGARFP